jgi:IclR family pca regulon transcriptional regulator
MSGDRPVRQGQERYFVESLARGLNVLRAFAPNRPELTLSQIASAAGVSNPSALRIGYTLVSLGYLTRNPLTKGYRLGPNVLSLGMAVLSSMTLLDIAEPFLKELRSAADETVKMAVLEDTEMLYIARYPSLLYPVEGSIFVGSRLPAHQTCTGRAILARFPFDQAREIVKRSGTQKFTNKSIVRIDLVMEELAKTRDRGYALNDQGTTVEHRSAAVAITGTTGAPIAAINVSVSAQRVALDALERTIVPHLLVAGKAISALIPPHFQGKPAVEE